MVSIGSIYHLIPVLFDKPRMYSIRLINVHFWLATVGVVLYIVAMWMSGVLQGLMWRAINADGTLTYSFVESLEASKPFYLLRFVGGVIVLSGMLIMAYNVYKTIRSESGEDVKSEEQKKNIIKPQTQPA
jgi:cytochrome c oxidase cbb3-type subunit 1